MSKYLICEPNQLILTSTAYQLGDVGFVGIDVMKKFLALASAFMFCSDAYAQDIYGPILDKTYPINRSMDIVDGGDKLFVEFTDKVYGYYMYQLVPSDNSLLVRVRTTNDRGGVFSNIKDHESTCGVIDFMAGERIIVTAFHVYDAKDPTKKRYYVDDNESVTLDAEQFNLIDSVHLLSGWCKGTVTNTVQFKPMQ